MKLTLEQIDQTIRNLGRLMPAKPNKSSTREYSLKESVFLMAPKLLEMKEMGFTSKELVKSLANEGIEIKDATLNRYLCEYQKQTQEKTESGPATETKPEQTSSANPDPAVGANPDPAVGANPEQATGAKLDSALEANPEPETESETESAIPAKSERTAAPDQSCSGGGQSYQTKPPITPDRQDTPKRDKYPTPDQSANRPKPSTWQSEKRCDNDSRTV